MKRVLTIFQDEEIPLLEMMADLRGMCISQYIRSCSLNAGVSVELPTSELIRAHTDEIMELKRSIKPYLQTIADSEYATDADIQNIVGSINELVESEKRILKQLVSMRQDIRKETSKSVQKAVQKQLKKERAKAA